MAKRKGAKKERGQARIQQLMEQFPEIPREMIVKADYINEGIRQTPTMTQVGKWAIPDAHILYEYGKEHPPQEDLEGGYTVTPFAFYTRNGMSHQVMYDSTGPYEIKYEGRGCYWLYRDGEAIEEVVFPPCPEWYRGTTSSGKPISSVVGLIGDRVLKIVPTNYCEFFKDGNQCRFCNILSTVEHFTELGRQKILVQREQDVYDIYMAAAKATGVDGIQISGGAFYDRKKEADLYLRMYDVVKRAMKDSGCVVPFGYASQPQEKEDLLRIKEAGATSAAIPMEVWEPRLFPIMCPGKNRSLGGRDHWIECVLNAVETFGWGRVSVNFVLGAEMVIPTGFKTEEEAAESVLAGFEFWASHGAVPTQIQLRTVPGAVLAKAPRPNVEYILKMELERYKVVKEHDLAPRGRGGGSTFSISGDWPMAEPAGPR